MRRKKLTYNSFDNGGWKWTKGAGLSTNMKNGYNAGAFNNIISSSGDFLGSTLSGGKNTGIGNAFSVLGQAAKLIPGPLGAFSSLGLGAASGIVNGLFGSKLNNENIAQIENENQMQKNMQFDAGTNDELLYQANYNRLDDFTKSDIGKEGIFSNTVTKKFNNLKDERNNAEISALNNLFTANQNLQELNRRNTLANISAFGGFLSTNNDENTYAKGGPIYNKNTKKWFNLRGQELNNPNGYYSKAGNLYTVYNSDGSVTKYRKSKNKAKPYVSVSTGEEFSDLGKLRNFENSYNNDVLFRYGVKSKNTSKHTSRVYNIPFIPEKAVTLSKAGLATGAKLSTNLLDSIAVHAKNVGLPIKTALGLATKESTLGNPTDDIKSRAKISRMDRALLQEAERNKELYGGEGVRVSQNINNGNSIDPESLVNYHNSLENPYINNMSYAFNRYKDLDDVRRILIDSENYVDKKARELENKPVRNILESAFLLYKDHPNKYNPGQSNYQELVNRRANEVWESPEIQEWYRNTPYKAFGGPLTTNGANWSNGIIEINEGGTHEENKYGGVPMGVDQQGVPNLVEEGELVYKDYVFSDRIMIPKDMKNKYKLKGNLTFSDAVKKLTKKSEERLNDPISKRTNDAIISEFIARQEDIRNKNVNTNTFAKGGFKNAKPINILPELKESIPTIEGINSSDISPIWSSTYFQSYNPNTNGNNNANLRYAPISGSLIGLSNTILNKPDYTIPNTIMNSANKAATYKPVSSLPLANYMSYNPIDKNRLINNINSQSAAGRNAVIDNSGGNRAIAQAGLIGNQYATQLGEANALIQGDKENLNRLITSLNFNKDTDTRNAEAAMRANTINQEAEARANSIRYNGVSQAMNIRNAIDSAREASINANLSNFFNTLGDIGRENFIFNQINNNKALKYNTDKSGNSFYKKEDKKKANGGYLTIKRKK